MLLFFLYNANLLSGLLGVAGTSEAEGTADGATEEGGAETETESGNCSIDLALTIPEPD